MRGGCARIAAGLDWIVWRVNGQARLRRLREQGLIDADGELTPRGEELAERLHRRPWRDVEDGTLDQPDPYPDSCLY